MKAEEIRAYELQTSVGTTAPLEDIAFLLRELTAQVAEMNERSRARVHAKQPRQPKQMTSAARRNGKRFFNHFWSTSVGEDMLTLFTPNQDQKWPGELEINESTIGTLGTNKNTKITRTQ